MSQLSSGLVHLKGEALSKVRAHIQNFWQSGSSARAAGQWKATPCPENLFEGHKTVGFFIPEARLDEAAMLPTPPASVQSAYPRCESACKMTFRLCSKSDVTKNSALGIFEAPAHAPEVRPSLIFVPALLADTLGHRIGRGGGFYDSYLALNPQTQSVGVLHSDYVLDQIPSHWLKAHDLKLSALLTDTQFFWCKEIPS